MIPFNHHHLYYFWVTAREGSVSKACRKLLLAQPTVSAQIRKLEKDLGVRLFERRKGRLVVTEEGALVRDCANKIFFHSRELLDSLKDPLSKTALRLGVCARVPLELCRSLLKAARRADKGARLSVARGGLESLLAELDSHALDLVLADEKTRALAHGRHLVARIGAVPVFWFAPADLARRVRSFPADLAKVPLALPASPSTLRAEVDRWLGCLEAKPRIAAEADSEEHLRCLALEGAAAPLSEPAADGRLIRLSRKPLFLRAYYLIAEKGHWLNPMAQKLLEEFRIGEFAGPAAPERRLKRRFLELPPAGPWPYGRKIVQTLE